MKYLLAPLAAALFAGSALADDALIQREDVRTYLDEISLQYGFNRAQLDELFRGVQLQPKIIGYFDRPSTGKPWHEFRNNYLQRSRAIEGARFWRKHEKVLADISRKYQVEPEIILAILNVETNYGRNQGKFRVIDVLTTVAFDYPRRSEYFRRELTEFLQLARQEGWDAYAFKGSYAGAMGWPQFMPSSFRNYAQDWDRDGHHDIWNNPADVLASVANYLKQFGWQHGKPAYAPVNFSGDAEALLADKFTLKYTMGELMQRGVMPVTEQNPQEKAVFFMLETAPGVQSSFVGYTNFYVITRYNKSTLYATAVLDLANMIKSAYRERADVAPPAAPAPRRTQRLRHG